MQLSVTAIETWKSVPTYPGYSVSSLGRVRRKLKRAGYHYLKPFKNPKTGYWQIGLIKNGKKYTHRLHRLILICFSTEEICQLVFKLGLTVNHHDGIKDNNHLSNLEWMTQGENRLHGLRNGLITQLKGEACPWSKLKEKDVRYIRLAWKKGNKNMRELSDMFRINKTTIWEIIHRQIWKEVK